MLKKETGNWWAGCLSWPGKLCVSSVTQITARFSIAGRARSRRSSICICMCLLEGHSHGLRDKEARNEPNAAGAMGVISVERAKKKTAAIKHAVFRRGENAPLAL